MPMEPITFEKPWGQLTLIASDVVHLPDGSIDMHAKFKVHRIRFMHRANGAIHFVDPAGADLSDVLKATDAADMIRILHQWSCSCSVSLN